MDTTRKLASFEAARANLPPGVKVILALRDYSLIELLLPDAPVVARVGIVFDHDRDPQILSVLGALVIIDRTSCANLIGLMETRGRVTSFWDAAPSAFIAGGLLRATLQQATKAALWPDEEWIVEPPTFVRVKDGVLDRAALDKDCPLLVIPERYALGKVKP